MHTKYSGKVYTKVLMVLTKGEGIMGDYFLLFAFPNFQIFLTGAFLVFIMIIFYI